MKTALVSGISAVATFLPMIALAASGEQGKLSGAVGGIGDAVALAVPIAAALVILAFFYGLAMYLFNFGEGKDEKQKAGRNLMIYSILALFVMVSIWGIIGLLQDTFGITNTDTADVPKLQGLNNILGQ